MTRKTITLVEGQLLFTLDETAVAIRTSKEKVRQLINRGDLTQSWIDSKPLIKREELQRFIDQLPSERPERVA